MIENITLKNITNINEAQIDLSSRINILIGDNGSGKSNIIKTFKFLNNLIKMDVKDALTDVYGHIECDRYWALNREKPTELELEFDQGLEYYLKIEGKNEPIITEERITQCGDLVYESEGEESVLSLNNGLSNSIIEYVKENIRDMEFHVKGFDKEATANILNRLLVSDRRNETLNMLRIACDIDDIEIRNNQGKLDLFVVERGGRILTWKMLSSGVAKYIGLVAALMNPSRSKLIFLENPDAFIHQDMIMDVAQLIFNGSEGSKIVLTTHSPYLLDVMQDCIDSILVLNRGTESTTVENISMDSLDEWLDKYSLGELWEKGQLGGNKW